MIAPGPRLAEYMPVVGPAAIDDIRALARVVEKRSVLMVNSTAVGGGVAELLTRLVPLLQDLGIQTRWEVIRGDQSHPQRPPWNPHPAHTGHVRSFPPGERRELGRP